MGSWGVGIFQNDSSADVRGHWREALMDGLDSEEATAYVLARHRELLADPEESRLFWLALAAAQSETGRLQPDVRDRALQIIAVGGDLDRWHESGSAAVNRRRRVLEQLASKLSGPQPKPARPRRSRPRTERRRGRRPDYPFEPKSNTWLEPGQFWGVPLSDGRYACGRVLALPDETDDLMSWGRSSKAFFAGLMGWCGEEPPAGEAIAGATLLEQGQAHIKTIRENGRFILGQRDLGLDNIVGLREVSHRGGGTVYLYEGARRLRPATREEAATLNVLSTWGFKVISVAAERYFVERRS